jgi:hypothetical protein
MMLFTAQMDALNRHRGKGTTQKIVIERVVVAPGGRAVVGAIANGGRGMGDNSSDQPRERQPFDTVVFDRASAVRSQIATAPYFVASPVKEPNVQIGTRGHVRFIDPLRVLLGSSNIGRVEISGRQSLMTADGDNLKTPNHLSLARGDPGDDRGLGFPRCRGRGLSWRLFRHLISHDRASLFRQLAAD